MRNVLKFWLILFLILSFILIPASTAQATPEAYIIVTPTSGLVTSEWGSTATFTIALNSPPSGTVTIELSSNDTSEGTVSPASVTFTSLTWNTSQTVTVTGVDDFAVDGNVPYSIIAIRSIELLAFVANGTSAASVSVINLDNDVADAPPGGGTNGNISVAPPSGIKGLELISAAVSETSLPDAGKPNLSFPYGFVSFNITGLQNGDSVTLTITFPDNVPVGSQYWKYQAPNWINVTQLMGDDDGDKVITLTLTDGGLGDADGRWNGTIVDPGALGEGPLPIAVGGEVSPIDIVTVLAPWLGLALVLALGGTALLLWRRRSHWR